MNDKEVTIILIILFIIQYSLDISQNECLTRLKDKKFVGFSNLAIHHLISIFANFGWLYQNKKILIVVASFTCSSKLQNLVVVANFSCSCKIF